MDLVLGLLPTAEFGESTKTLGPCLVIQQTIGIPPKPGVLEARLTQPAQSGFTVSWSKSGSNKCAGPPGNGSVAWE